MSALVTLRNVTKTYQRGPEKVQVLHGSDLEVERGVFAAPGFPLEDEIDPTGAGDSFAGGLVGYLASQPHLGPHTLRRAMIHATATASFCVEAVGTRKISKVSHADVARRVQEIRALYDFGAHTM